MSHTHYIAYIVMEVISFQGLSRLSVVISPHVEYKC